MQLVIKQTNFKRYYMIYNLNNPYLNPDDIQERDVQFLLAYKKLPEVSLI